MSEDDYKDVHVIHIEPTPEERAIVEAWLVPNKTPIPFNPFNLSVLHSPFSLDAKPQLPMPIYSRGALSRHYDNPDPSYLRPAFRSDEKYFAFLDNLTEGKYEVDLEDFHPHLYGAVVDCLIYRIKIHYKGRVLGPLLEDPIKVDSINVARSQGDMGWGRSLEVETREFSSVRLATAEEVTRTINKFLFPEGKKDES